ncbi:glutamyl-tRNA reductase [Mangrovibacterium diazotrophicum]|uniref:Glutamyl-tRNA reductase n=1 Tax=Mangrovibacterium diazotrophicum TaxID=1261403 RepID=A0A419VYF6_9BACT|nr:glutamyl-tRNA reductase [Mangrovibacterium diazotrophicum]RKD88204.1 glutamyl-tRNA reductase [Mangrovibacterium diazotrophicum]
MIGIIGLSHKSAPVNIREKFALNQDDSAKLAKLICHNKYIQELVILSTCNRTELYFKADECCSSGAFNIIISFLHKHVGVDDELNKHFYRYAHDKAVNHLFRVVSSLESMVLGEYQIVSQIKEAFNQAEQNGTVGKVLTRLFHKALETGKLVRSNTKMSTGAFSVSYAAVEKCNNQFKNLKDKNILLIGAGETGELVIKNLYKKGCKNITVTNRTITKAEELAKRYSGKTLPYNQMMEGIHEAEIIVSSIATKEPIFNAATVKPHLNGHPLVMMIDLGVPRNIHHDVADIPGIALVNVDDLEEVVSGNQEKKQALVSVAEEIIAEKVGEFSDWLNSRNLSPAIQQIIASMNMVNTTELELFKKFHSDEDYQQMEKYGKHITEKLINSMIKNLKTISDNGRQTEYIKVVNDLFSQINEQ